jgi:hypothetical protein
MAQIRAAERNASFAGRSVADAANKFDKNDLLLIHLLIYYFYTPNLP